MKLLVKTLLFATICIVSPVLAAAAPIHDAVALGPMAKEAIGPSVDARGRHRTGIVRALPKAASLGAWSVEGGAYVARARASSEGAAGLRVRIDLGTMPGAVELRATGTDGRVETMSVDPRLGPEAWTPWTEGASQVIEVISAVQPSEGALRIGAVVHMTEAPFAKAAASCTVSTSCPTGNATLDAAILERKKSLLRISFIDGGASFVCSATLVDTPLRPAAYVLTAQHCIGNETSASTISSNWFFEQTPCGTTTISADARQVNGGMSVVFTNYNVDMTLMLMNTAPPPGVTYSPMNPARLNDNDAVVSLSHPRGDASRLTTGTVVGEGRNFDLPYDQYFVRMNLGLIEPGSSGSGLFSMVAGSLQLRGVTSAADDELSCTNSTAPTIFGRVEILYPEIAQYVGLSTQAPDDAPNRAKDLFSVPFTGVGPDVPLNLRATAETDLGAKQINYPGDVDIYRFYLTATTVVSAFTTGTFDTVATLLDSRGEALAASDDAQLGNLNAGVTKVLDSGTYYIHVASWDPAATGAYNLTLRADNIGRDNYTALWWNAAESGWGVNVNHQGSTIFATLFTYDDDGTPMWLVLSSGTRQADGSFSGDLVRTTGPVFNASPWTAVSTTTVGTMRFTFHTAQSATLVYSVNGVTVTKSITRQEFSTMPDCSWSLFDRTFAFNYQDLWWNPAEPGWGINLTHQGSIIFATLFTYGADGKARWYVMSNGSRTAPGIYSGTLYRTTGPVFYANPWGVTNVTPVGNMNLNVANGNTATLFYDINGVSVSKQIQRQVFSTPKTECEP